MPFTEEVNKALLDRCGDKALGPNDMTMAFLQSNLNIVKTYVMKMFSEFFSSEKFVTNLNTTFLLASFQRK